MLMHFWATLILRFCVARLGMYRFNLETARSDLREPAPKRCNRRLPGWNANNAAQNTASSYGEDHDGSNYGAKPALPAQYDWCGGWKRCHVSRHDRDGVCGRIHIRRAHQAVSA